VAFTYSSAHKGKSVGQYEGAGINEQKHTPKKQDFNQMEGSL